MNGVGDFIAVSALALKVYRAYKDAPDEYKHISDEVKSLHGLIEGVQRLEMAALSCSQQQNGKEILQCCHCVLEDLEAFIEKYKSLNKFTRVKLSLKDMTALRTKLISNTMFLHVFIQSCFQSRIEDSQYRMETTQSEMRHLLLEMKASWLQQRDSVTTSAGSINSRKAFEELSIKLHQIGVRGDMIKRKEMQVLDIFRGESISISPAVDTVIEGGQFQAANNQISHAPDITGEGGQPEAAISYAFDTFLEEKGQSQAVNDQTFSTASPAAAHTTLSRNAIRLCVLCFTFGTLLAGAWFLLDPATAVV